MPKVNPFDNSSFNINTLRQGTGIQLGNPRREGQAPEVRLRGGEDAARVDLTRQLAEHDHGRIDPETYGRNGATRRAFDSRRPHDGDDVARRLSEHRSGTPSIERREGELPSPTATGFYNESEFVLDNGIKGTYKTNEDGTISGQTENGFNIFVDENGKGYAYSSSTNEAYSFDPSASNGAFSLSNVEQVRAGSLDLGLQQKLGFEEVAV